MQTTPSLLDVITHTLAVMTAVIGAMLPVLVPLMPQIINFVGGFFKDARHRRVFEHVSRAGLAAASAGSARMREVMDLAQRPESRGGAVVTPEEQADITAHTVTAAVAAGLGYLEQAGVMKEVVAVYGSEELVKSSLESIVHHKWFGSSVAAIVPPVPPATEPESTAGKRRKKKEA